MGREQITKLVPTAIWPLLAALALVLELTVQVGALMRWK